VSGVGSSLNYPSSIVTYVDDTTCVQDTDNEDCVYSYEACLSTYLGIPLSDLEDLMINPPKVNVQDNQIYSPGTNKTWGQYISSTTTQLRITDCYTAIAYDNSLPLRSFEIEENGNTCGATGKCDRSYILLESCGNGNVFVGSFSYAVLTGSSITTGDTIYAPALFGTTIANVDNAPQSVLGQTTGSCYTVIGGTTSSISVPQDVADVGTDWSLSTKQFSTQSSCSDGDCGCKTNFTVTNTGGPGTTFSVKKCDGTTYTVGPLPSGGSVTVSDCIDMNSFWLSARIAGHYNEVEISGSYDNC
jgi:hypothetical protein